jgi:hypothetical protein
VAELCLHCGARGATFYAGGPGRWCSTECFIACDILAEAEEALGIEADLTFSDREPDERRGLTYRPRAMPDLVGQVFGALRVEKRQIVEGRGRVRRMWLCRCACGRTTLAKTEQLLDRGLARCSACAQARRQIAHRKPIGGIARKDLAARLGLTVKGMEARLGRGVPVEALLAEAAMARRAVA